MRNAKQWLAALAAVLIATWAGPVLAQGFLADQGLLEKIRPGVTKAQEVRDLLGQPARVLNFPARGIQALEYEARDYGRKLVISIAVGTDGTVRDIQRLSYSFP